MEIRTETIIIGICAFVLVSIMIANVFVSSNNKHEIFCTSNLCMVLAIIFILLPIALIQVYSVQCMIHGGCDRFVWFIVGFAILLTCVYIGLFVWKITKQKNAQVIRTE